MHDAPFHLPEDEDLFQFSIDSLSSTVMQMFKKCLISAMYGASDSESQESSGEDELTKAKLRKTSLVVLDTQIQERLKTIEAEMSEAQKEI